MRMDNITNCPYCETLLDCLKDNEVKICNTCKLRWHYRDDDNSWRCYSIATQADLFRWLKKDLDILSDNELQKKYSIQLL